VNINLHTKRTRTQYNYKLIVTTGVQDRDKPRNPLISKTFQIESIGGGTRMGRVLCPNSILPRLLSTKKYQYRTWAITTIQYKGVCLVYYTYVCVCV